MVNWHKLPVEILAIVLKEVPDVKQVAKCRLVCKAWDPVAEKEMFSKKFDVFYNRNRYTKAIRHLEKKLYLGLSITHLELAGSYYNPEELSVIKKFLRLAFTPSIKVVEGSLFYKEELISYLYEIASKSKTKFAKLERLPITFPTTEADAKLIYLTRGSAQVLHLTCSKENQSNHQKILVDHLEEFGALTKLVLRYEKRVDNLEEMESILRKCSHLKQFELQVGFHESFSMSKDELNKWLVKNVTKNPDVLQVKLERVAYPEIVEYLHYKFPNATSVDIRGRRSESLKRLLPVVKDMANVEIQDWGLDSMEEIKTLATALNSKKTSVSISDTMHCTSGLVDVNVSKCKSDETTKFEFGICEKKHLLPGILSAVGDVVDSVDFLFLPFEEDDENDEKESAFYTVLTALPSLKKLVFTDNSIKNQPSSIENTVLHHLTKVEINGTMLTSEALPVLSKIAPNLKHLTLGTCYFDTANLQHQKLIMPDSSLETMCITDYHFDGLYDSGFTDEKDDLTTWIREQMCVEEDEYMFLQVTESAPRKDRSFILKASEPTFICKLVSKKQFNANVGSWPRIQVKCKSLKSLIISLRSVKTTIDLRENRPVEDVADWNFVKKPSEYPRPRVYKRDSILVRMRKENFAIQEYYERKEKRERNLERYGVSDSADYEGSDYSLSEDDYYY